MPVITAAQLLDWTDGRNGSQFANVRYDRGLLSFQLGQDGRARGLEAMLPASAANGALNHLTRNGQDITGELRSRTVKGITYHVFPGASGAYVATYGVPGTTPPPAVDPTPGTGGTGGTKTPGTGGQRHRRRRRRRSGRR